jgi:hypothetical protein
MSFPSASARSLTSAAPVSAGDNHVQAVNRNNAMRPTRFMSSPSFSLFIMDRQTLRSKAETNQKRETAGHGISANKRP